MKLDNINRWLALLANVGVIAGIVFLAVEIQQNNELLLAQTAYNSRESTTEVAEAIYQNHDLRVTLSKRARGEELTDLEQLQLKALAERVLRGMQWRYQEQLAGRDELDPVGLRAVVLHPDPYMNSGIPENWAELKVMLSDEFVEYMETNIFDR